MDSMGQTLVVRNTFIDMVSYDPYEALERTKSDPTGGRTKNVLPFARSPEEQLWQTQQANAPPLLEGTSAEEACKDDNVAELMSVAPERTGGLHDMEEDLCCANQMRVPYIQENIVDSSATSSRDDHECCQDDDNHGALGRTKSSVYPHASMQALSQPSNAHGGFMDSTLAGAMAISLNEILPEGKQEAVDAHTSLGRAYAGFHVLHTNTTLGWKPTLVPFAISVGGFGFTTDMHDHAAIQQTLAPLSLLTMGSGLPIGSLHSFHE